MPEALKFLDFDAIFFMKPSKHYVKKPDTTKICREQKTAELAEFAIQSRLGRMEKFLVYAMIFTK